MVSTDLTRRSRPDLLARSGEEETPMLFSFYLGMFIQFKGIHSISKPEVSSIFMIVPRKAQNSEDLNHTKLPPLTQASRRARWRG
jgi:hypothetical protein